MLCWCERGESSSTSGAKWDFIGGVFPDDDESDEESVKKTNKCSLVWEVSHGGSIPGWG